MNKIAIIGGGNAGTTMAAQLKQLDQTVSLYDVIEAQLQPILENDNTVVLTGKVDTPGSVRLDLVTMDLAEAIAGAGLIICSTPAHAHRLVARDLAPHLESGQIILLNPGRTGGVLEFHQTLQAHNCRAEVLVIEAQTILQATRREGTTIHIFGMKQRVWCAGLSRADNRPFFDLIQPLFPQFMPAPSLWHTSLHNIGMLFHPTPTLLNLGRMESDQPFDYYHDGFSPTIAELVERLDRERLAVAQALGITLPGVIEWLEESYGATGSNLYHALQNNTKYEGIRAPLLQSIAAKQQLRYVVEDVPMGLVPVSELGHKLGVETPAMNTIIDLANLLYETDFRANGRNLAQLGLADLSAAEIKAL